MRPDDAGAAGSGERLGTEGRGVQHVCYDENGESDVAFLRLRLDSRTESAWDSAASDRVGPAIIWPCLAQAPSRPPRPSRAMEPLEVLFEAPGLPSADLPAELAHLYGGTIGFAEPRLITNFVATVDGVVAIPSIPGSNALVAGDSESDRFVIGLLRAFADVVLVGAGTLAASPEGTWRPERVYPQAAVEFAELRRLLGKREQPEVAVVTGRGSIDPSHPVLASGAVVLTSTAGVERLRDAVPEATTLVSLGDAAALDPRRVVAALHERGASLVLSEAGPHTFGSLVEAGVVDELFLTVSPRLAGNRGDGSRLGLAEGVTLLPPGVREHLLGVRRDGDYLFLRYELAR
jgi:riboflavin biosynthesis pyrimidine reductase